MPQNTTVKLKQQSDPVRQIHSVQPLKIAAVL